MSTASVSSSQTIYSSEYESDDEGPCSNGGDFSGYDYLTSKPLQGSIDADCESEADDDESVVDKMSASFTFTAGAAEHQAQETIRRQPQQDANLAWEDPAILETSWTDEKHSLYLNSIEEGFVQSLYEGGRYTHSRKRWECERRTTSVSSEGLHEDVEPGNSCDYQSFNLFPDEKGAKAQRLCNDEEIQHPTKRFSLDSVRIKQGHEEDNINGRVNNCKSLNEPAEEGFTETGDVPNEYTPKIQMQCSKYTYKRDLGRNKEISERYMHEDQVVPSMENTT